MAGDSNPAPRDLRKLILVKPVLDYSALEPGESASNIIRDLAKNLQGAKVRLTGSVALNDEEFATKRRQRYRHCHRPFRHSGFCASVAGAAFAAHRVADFADADGGG